MMTVAIAIATSGRSGVLTESLEYFKSIDLTPEKYIICPSKKEDVDEKWLKEFDGSLSIVYGGVGLPVQRNTLLSSCDCDIVLFFDDDFLPAKDYLDELVDVFERFPEVVMVTGTVVADGILGKGYSHSEGVDILNNLTDDIDDHIEDVYNGYGCNMAIRMESIRKYKFQFDENLPLYAWLEDLDYSRQIAHLGRIVRSQKMKGVHLGTKLSGRTPGKKLGYSQVANPVYLARKGTMSWIRASKQISRNIMANILFVFKSEPWVDRSGRRSGNWLAIKDLLKNKISPQAIKYIE